MFGSTLLLTLCHRAIMSSTGMIAAGRVNTSKASASDSKLHVKSRQTQYLAITCRETTRALPL